MNPRNPLPGWFIQALFLAAALACTSPSRAFSATANDPAKALKMYLEQATTGLPGRVEISIGALDDRMRLAPCAQVEPYVPQGSRLWGRSSIGLKCVEGASWNVFLPVEVKVFGRALVASRPMSAGQPASSGDVREEEIELTREAGTVVTNVSQIEGKSTVRMVAVGQVLKQDFFRAPPAIGAGDAVQVVYSGTGFSILTGGRALSNASDGQPVRVQTESGKIVQGIARSGRVVDLK